MKKNLSLLVFLYLLYFSAGHAYGQVKAGGQTTHYVWGVVQDSTKRGLPGTTVAVRSNQGDSAFTSADSNGIFFFPEVIGNKITVTISSIGYETLVKHFILDSAARVVGLDTFRLERQANFLTSVVVTGVVPITIKEDTVEYSVAAYKVRDNATIEDLLKKLPGVEVDAAGNVTAQGKAVTGVKVNGKDFFNGDVKAATQNIPADMVQSVQVIDDYGTQASKTGIKTGEPAKILNINTRADKSHGYTAQVVAGDGSDLLPNKPGISNDDRYVGSINVLDLNGKQQIAVLGSLNNTNSNTFTFGSGGGSGGGGGGSAPIAINPSSLSMMAGAGATTSSPGSDQNGITVARSGGVNYRDDWGKSITSYGSYSFADNTVYNKTYTLQDNTSLSDPATTVQTNIETDINTGHRFNWNIDYEPNDFNSLKIAPSVTYQSMHSDVGSASTSTVDSSVNQAYTSSSNGHSSAPAVGLLLNYNHHFKRTGQNLNMNFTINQSTTDQYQNPVFDYTAGLPSAPTDQQISSHNRTERYASSTSFVQPLNKSSSLEFLYTFNYSSTNFTKNTYVLDSLSKFSYDTSLSTIYSYAFIRQRAGLNYRFVKKDKYNYTIGIAVEPSILEGNSPLDGIKIHNYQTNIIPTARFVYNFAKNKTITLNYSGNSGSPGFSQLQPVIDFSNAMYPVQGNPDLHPQVTNTCSLNFNQFDLSSGNSLFANMIFTQIQNKIVTNVTSYPSDYPENPSLQGTYLTQYLNANGYYTGSASINFAKPWDNRKYTVTFSTAAQFTNNIGYLSSVDSTTNIETSEKNTARTLTLKPGIRFRIDLENIIDAQVSTSYAINRTTNTISNYLTGASSDFRTLTIGINGKNYFKDWTLSYDFTKMINYGYSIPIGPMNILNTYVERTFLKGHRGTIRLAVFDVFNQNTGYSSTASSSSITETSSMRLGRYFLASFSFRLERFAAAPVSTKN